MSAASRLKEHDFVAIAVKSGGQPIDPRHGVVSIVVQRELNTLASAEIVLAGAAPASDPAFAPGSQIELSASHEGKMSPLFVGRVARCTLQIDVNATKTVVSCVDAAIELTQIAPRRCFVSQTDADVMATLIGEGGVVAEVTATGEVIEQRCQLGVSNWEFLLTRAAANGCFVSVVDGRVIVRPAAAARRPVVHIKNGHNLLSATLSLGRARGISAEEITPALGGRVVFAGVGGLNPGDLLKLTGFSPHHDGNAFVCAVRHEIAEGNWTTAAELGAPSLPQISPPVAMTRLHTGRITLLEGDPARASRVQITLAGIDSGYDRLWAHLSTPFAAPGGGFCFRPDVGTRVVVAFLDGDDRVPVVVGCLPCETEPSRFTGEPMHAPQALVTRNSLSLVFDDATKAITLSTPGGNRLILSDEKRGLSLQDQNGNALELGPQGIRLTTFRDIMIEAKGALRSNSVCGLELHSAANATLSGMDVKLEAQTQLVARGGASAELSASGQTVVRGALVMIN